jgi:hypothetical protein
MNKIIVLLASLFFALGANAQEPVSAVEGESNNSSNTATTEQQTTQKKQSATADKKVIRETNINLQTTVTGNQEQPRVMYILPWQSPLSPDLEMEMLSSQEESVFGHVEREELTRELEAADELQ